MRSRVTRWAGLQLLGLLVGAVLVAAPVLVRPALVAAQEPEPESAASTPTPIVAPIPEQIAAGAAVITADAITRHLRVMADDSMRGRETPSPGLEATARYVAAQFQALGLRPATSNGRWFQRYLLPPELDLVRSQVVFTANGQQASAGFTTAAHLVDRTVPPAGPPAPAVLVAGKQTPAAVAQLTLRGRVVLYVPQHYTNPVTAQQVLDELREGSRGVVILSRDDSADFAGEIRQALAHPDVRLGTTWSATVRLEAAAGFKALLAAQGVDLARVRADTAPLVRELPALTVAFETHFTRPPNDTTSAPNVVAVLEGADPKLQEQCVLLLAHMDHTGILQRSGSAGRADSIANGANDNASGVAGLLALAQAFSQPGARPARSLAFVLTSGGAKNFWGSRAVAGQLDDEGSSGSLVGGVVAVDELTIPRAVLALNLDMLGGPATRGAGKGMGKGAGKGVGQRAGGSQGAGGSVVVDGLSDVDVPALPSWVAATHPELQLGVEDGGPAATPASDHYPFVQQAVPSLFFHTGSHEESGAEAVEAVDADLAARITRLAYYVTQELANTNRMLQWTAAGRGRYLEALQRP